MSNSGSLFGWLVTAGLVLTVLNYPVKLLYRKAVAGLPRESKLRQAYIRVQRFVVGNHRFFALFTALVLLAHVIVQLLYRWLSWTGLAAAALMVANLLVGAYGYYIKKRKKSAWLVIHVTVALLLIAAILGHLATGGR
ncbi:MAG TPA: hypothetical protein PK646_01595 [Bacillota bacterium]|jgi:hypothetical protein|nr:hypothetical protein [Fastidiosipila sp.]HPX92959.1 hypothetical protein [Bacillota bacterium]HQB80773.1 hypothetical protein [Bacillota bacterium]